MSAGLTPDQRETLANFQAVTQAATDTAVEVLQSTNWNLERAVSAVYDPPTRPQVTPDDYEDHDPQDDEPAAASERRPMMDTFGIDDSQVGQPNGVPRRGGRRGSQGGGPVGGALWWVRQFHGPLQVLAWPIGLLWQAATVVLGLLARLLHIRPGTASLRPRNPFATPPGSISRLDPTTAAERLVRSLEESTGAVRWSRRNEPAANSSSLDEGSSSVEVGTSADGLRRRGGAAGRKALPDFWVGSYDSAVRKAKTEARVLMLVLTCEEHESHDEFVKTTLTDPDLLALLESEQILVWGGDVRAKDAYQTSKIVQAIRLPMIGFVSLLPASANPQARNNPTTQPTMALLSRLESLDSLAPAAICSHLSTAVLPRVSVFLNRQRAQIASREAERRLRAEQDRAVEQAAAKDVERVLKRRAEEARKQRDSIEKERAEEEKREKAKVARRVRVGAAGWRAKVRAELDRKGEPEKGLRVGVRLGDGRRVTRRFGASEEVEVLYGWVECELETEKDRLQAREDEGELDEADRREVGRYEHEFAFTLATTFPRKVVECAGTVGGWEGGGLEGAQLVVEGLEERRRSMGDEGGSDDDDEEVEE